MLLLMFFWSFDFRDCTLGFQDFLPVWDQRAQTNYDLNSDGVCDVLDLSMHVGDCAGPLTIQPIADQRAQPGDTYEFTPSANLPVVWFKEYGPDSLTVDRTTGLVRWSIPGNLPWESFHLGVKAVDPTNGDKVLMTWVLTVGRQDVFYVGPNEQLTTLRRGMEHMNGGDTLIIRNGTYPADDQFGGGEWGIHGTEGVLPPSGSSSGFTTVMAEDPGQVIFDGQGWSFTFILFNSVQRTHIAFKGMEARNYLGAAIGINGVQWIKLIDIGVMDSGRASWAAPGPQNVVNLSVSQSSDVLVEGVYTWGYSRYQLLAYQSERVVFRRCVSRMDAFHGTDPVGCFQFYCSQDTHGQNLIAIDGNQHQFWTNTGYSAAAFGMAATNCQSSPPTNSYHRSIALNLSRKLLDNFAQDSSVPGQWHDVVGWDLFTDRYFNGTGANIPAMVLTGAGLINRMTLGDIDVDSPGFDAGGGFLNLPYQPVTIENSVLYRLGFDGVSTQDRGPLVSEWSGVGSVLLDYVSIHDFQNDWVQAGQTSRVTVANATTADPRQAGLRYLPRIEAGSVLASAGKNGERLGAEVMTFKGRSGTFYGESGWDEETGIAMWPFPHEDLIKARFADYAYQGPTRDGSTQSLSGARGFAADGNGLTGKPITLTSYIWEYLGLPCPADICDYGY